MPPRDPKPFRKTVTRHETRDGKRCSATTPGAKKVKTRTESYYYRPAGGRGDKRTPVPLGTTDYTEAVVRMRDLMRREREEAVGISTPLIGHAGRPIGEHVEAWLASVQDGRAGADRLELLRRRVHELARLAGWRRVSDITRESCTRALTLLERTPGPGSASKGRSVQTRNHYLGHMRQFTRWLALPSTGRLASDPLAGMRGLRVEGHERHRRRCPTAEEVRILFAWLHSPAAPARNGMTGPHRALMYTLAMATGYRAGEVRGLSRANFGPAWEWVRLGSLADKARRRRREMPLPSWLSAELLAWEAGGGGLFAAAGEKNAGRFLKHDLGLARKAWVAGPDGAARARSTTLLYKLDGIDGPEFFDFHSLRHWYVTHLGGQAGIDPLTLASLARHSDPRLTLERYGHAGGEGARRAVEGMPRPGG